MTSFNKQIKSYHLGQKVYHEFMQKLQTFSSENNFLVSILKFPCLDANNSSAAFINAREALNSLEAFRFSIVEEFALCSDATSWPSTSGSSSDKSTSIRINGSYSDEEVLDIGHKRCADVIVTNGVPTSMSVDIDRVDIFMLSFVALPPPEITEECFMPMPHLSHMDMFTTPIFEIDNTAFFLLQFRAQLWIGVGSTAVCRLKRCRDVLHWVRSRKTLVLDSSANDGEAASRVSYDRFSRPCVDRRRSAASLPACRLRQCSAVMTALSGEVFGISPLQLSSCKATGSSPELVNLFSSWPNFAGQQHIQSLAEVSELHNAIMDWVHIVSVVSTPAPLTSLEVPHFKRPSVCV